MKKLLILFLLLTISLSVFAQSTDEELTTQADVIRNETTPGGNTKARVANMFQALIDSKVSVISSSIVQRVTKNVTSAELLALGDTPITVIASPGANKVYNIVSVLLSYKYVSAVYNFNGADFIQIRVGSSVFLMAASNMNTGSSNNYQMYKTTGSGFSSTNTAITIGCSINPTLGDGDLDVIVFYTIEDVNQ